MRDDPSATRYHRVQLCLAGLGLALLVAYLLGALLGGTARAIARAAAPIGGGWWWQVTAVAAVLSLAWSALSFPITWLGGYWLPRRFGLLHQRFLAWLADRLKAAAIGGVLGLGGLLTIEGLLRVTGAWWVWAAAVFFVAYVLIAALFPVLVLPLFYRTAPLADAGLRDRLLGLAQKAGVNVVDVWVVDQSRKSRTANAALVGLGHTRRIVLFDTLVKDFAPAEIESVLAHELGHHVHCDLWRGLGAQGALTLGMFGLADVLGRAGAPFFGLDGLADPAGVPWLALVLLLVGLVATPLGNTFSRWLERQADDWALAVTGNATAFVGALERLARLNLAERRPHRLKEIVLYSHPALDRRIARARGGAA